MPSADAPEMPSATHDEADLPAPLFRKPRKPRKPLVIAVTVIVLLCLITLTKGRHKTTYEASVANRGKVVIETPEVKVVEAAPPGWGAKPSGPGTAEPREAPVARSEARTPAPSTPSSTPSATEPAPAAKDEKPDSKAQPAPSKASKRLRPVRVVKRRLDGRQRQIVVRSPQETAEELNRIEQALKPGSPKRKSN